MTEIEVEGVGVYRLPNQWQGQRLRRLRGEERHTAVLAIGCGTNGLRHPGAALQLPLEWDSRGFPAPARHRTRGRGHLIALPKPATARHTRLRTERHIQSQATERLLC